jgi:homoserine kinase
MSSKTILARVRVPATTSNLGPGFDALGLSLKIYNEVTIEPAERLEIEIEGEGASELPRDGTNLMVRSIERACATAGVAMPAVRLTCTHAIPPARGLGSSGAAVVAGLLAGDVITQGALGRERILDLATEIEGHPDNVTPAIFGGLQAAVIDANKNVVHAKVPAHAFPRVALFIPDFPMPTRAARAVLPETLSRSDAVFNLSRTALLVAALASGDDAPLAVATEDALHQRPREALFPAMTSIFAAAREAGALGVWLSGAGSTIAAFVRETKASAVGDAMAHAARDRGVSGRAVVTEIDEHGAEVLREHTPT